MISCTERQQVRAVSFYFLSWILLTEAPHSVPSWVILNSRQGKRCTVNSISAYIGSVNEVFGQLMTVVKGVYFGLMSSFLKEAWFEKLQEMWLWQNPYIYIYYIMCWLVVNCCVQQEDFGTSSRTQREFCSSRLLYLETSEAVLIKCCQERITCDEVCLLSQKLISDEPSTDHSITVDCSFQSCVLASLYRKLSSCRLTRRDKIWGSDKRALWDVEGPSD